jgi:hypothetical protein
MTPSTLFSIIIKIFGLLFIKLVIETAPQLLLPVLYGVESSMLKESLWILLFTGLMLVFYLLCACGCLFKTNTILNRLRLTKDFNEAPFSVNFSPAAVFTIALFIIAGITLVDEIPHFCRFIFDYFQQQRLMPRTPPGISNGVVIGAKIIIALLLIGERKRIVSFLLKREDMKETKETGEGAL